MSERVKEYVHGEAEKLEWFYSPLINCEVTITEEHRGLRAVVSSHVNGQTLRASEDADGVYAAIDGAMGKMQRQLKKLHDKRRRPRVEPPSAEDLLVETEE